MIGHGAPGRRSVLCALLATLAIPAVADPPHRPLHTARQVQSLTIAEAARGYPVHLDRARVLYVDPGSKAVFLLQGAEGVPARHDGNEMPAVRSGDVASVDGMTARGDMQVMILHAQFRVISHERLPSPQRISLHSVFSGDYDSQWVAVDGVIKSARLLAPGPGGQAEAELVLAAGPDQLEVTTQNAEAKHLRDLVDSKVRINAVIKNRYNERSLLVGTRMFMPDPAYLRVLERAAPDPFALPVRPVAEVIHMNGTESVHRVHIRGVVTSIWDDQHFSIMNTDRGMWVATEAPVQLEIGDFLDLAGFPATGEATAYLDRAIVRRTGLAAQPRALRLTFSEALAGTHDAELIEMQGRLFEKSPGDKGGLTLVLAEGKKSFVVVLPPAFPVKELEAIQAGSLLAVRGVCVVHADNDHTPTQFNILVRQPVDIAVLDSPTWWSPKRALLAAGVLFAPVLGVILWNAVLRHQVRGQTRLIQSQLEEAQALRRQFEVAHQQKSLALNNLMRTQRELLLAQEKLQYQVTHDALTGLFNRAAVLELFQKEIDRAGRQNSSVGILLLDIDHFKRVNDTQGHLAGDAVLEEMGRRLSETMRSYDIAGRYGGEEFLIILPGCGKNETLSGAERIRTAVASRPFRVENAEFCLTVSIGVTVAHGSAQVPDAVLLSQADMALYSAKDSGRNRVVMNEQPLAVS